MMSQESSANAPPSMMDGNNSLLDDNPVDSASMNNTSTDYASTDDAWTDDASADNPSIDTADDSALTRITNLPIVTSALTSVSNAYQWTKDSSSIIGYSLDVAERSVAMAAHTAQPVINCFDRPISAINSVANQQLDKLEEKVPLITEPSDKVVESLKESAWDAVEQGKVTGTQKMNDLMNTRLGQVVTSTVDAALGLSDRAVEYYLPEEKSKLDLEEGNNDGDDSSDDEDDDDAEQPQGGAESAPLPSNPEPFSNSVQKASRVSTKVRRRLYRKALVNIQYAQKRSQDTLQKLHFTVDLITYARENIDSANSGIRCKVDSTQENLWNTWNDWTTEHGEEGDVNKEDEDIEAKSGEQKTLAIARNLTRRMRALSNNIAASIRVLPQNIRKSVEDARGTIEQLFDTFEEAQYFKDLPSSILTSAKERLEILSAASLALTDYLVNSSAMQWLVPYPFRQIVSDSLSSKEINEKEKTL